MTGHNFPEIPGVSFKLIPGYEGNYAIASDRIAWVGYRGCWRKMISYKNAWNGGDTIMLRHPNAICNRPHEIDDLMKLFEV